MPDLADKIVLPLNREPAAQTTFNANADNDFMRLEGVSYRDDNRHLLNNVSLSLNSSSITGIMGFNGAGKSMLMKVMHGIIEPSAGSVLWGGATATHAMRMQQAMVFQKPVLLRRSVLANLAFVLKRHNRNSTAQQHGLLETVGLTDKAKQAARSLSGGEQQRLALARALACQPSVLFLDECTASLDPASTSIIENVVLEQAARSTKVILVTHDAAQARRICDDVIFMHQGRLQEHASSDTFFKQPASEAAQAFLNGQLI